VDNFLTKLSILVWSARVTKFFEIYILISLEKVTQYLVIP
jgi:hypothetical protein